MATKEEFIEAIENDEYAEFELPTGDVLVTDWEGDGLFFPYVVPKNGNNERGGEIGDAIVEVFNVRVQHVEVDDDGDQLTFYPIMDTPSN